MKRTPTPKERLSPDGQAELQKIFNRGLEYETPASVIRMELEEAYERLAKNDAASNAGAILSKLDGAVLDDPVSVFAIREQEDFEKWWSAQEVSKSDDPTAVSQLVYKMVAWNGWHGRAMLAAAKQEADR